MWAGWWYSSGRTYLVEEAQRSGSPSPICISAVPQPPEAILEIQMWTQILLTNK